MMPGDAVGDLRMLTARKPDGHRVQIVCSVCRQGAFEKRGDLYHCWNCDGAGDVLAPDGDGWKMVKTGSAP